jgi:hypothetical protein
LEEAFIALPTEAGVAAVLEGLGGTVSGPGNNFLLDDWAGVRSFTDATDDTGDCRRASNKQHSISRSKFDNILYLQAARLDSALLLVT